MALTTFKNTTAIAFSRVVSVLINILILPIYGKMMGYEAFGLISFYTTLQASFVVLDFGLSATLSRELAKEQNPTYKQNKINLAYTIEVIYWVVGIVIGLSLFLCAPLIAKYWVNAQKISFDTLQQSIRIMAIILMFQWAHSIYNGGLTGMQKLVKLNIQTIFFNVLKNIGVIIAMWMLSPSVYVFLLWQLLITIVFTFVLRYSFWHELVPERKQFSKTELFTVGRFALGMTGIGLSTLLLGQIDKLLISKMMSLEQFGYYTLAFAAGSNVLIGISIFLPTFLPTLTNLISKGDIDGVKQCYHNYSNIIAIIAIPTALLMAFYSKEILLIWTHDPKLAEQSYLLVRFVALGYMINGLSYGYFNLMLAYGWTRYTIYQNILSSIISIPLMYYSVANFGITGGASVCFILSIGAILIGLPYTHTKLLKHEFGNVLKNDFGVPLIISLLIISISRIFFPVHSSYWVQLFLLGVILSIALLLNVYASSNLKNIVKSTLQQLLKSPVGHAK